jgi:hypothetical protein
VTLPCPDSLASFTIDAIFGGMALLSACLCLRLYPASRTSGRETDEAARFPWKQALITCFVAGLVLA